MSISALEPRSAPASASGRRVADRRSEARAPQRSLVVDQGCDVRAGHVRLEPAAVLALLAWLPLTHGDLAPVEARAELLDPVAALALVLRPPTIWSAREAVAFRGLAPEGRRECDLVTALHSRRLRRAAAGIALQLPLSGLPRASELVAQGCAIVMRDAAACANAAAVQLVRYATSELIRGL